jgi:deoxycytidine triphosphate deaminase
MLLTDKDLRTLICTNEKWHESAKIHIYPFSEDCLTPVGYDVRVGTRYSSVLLGKYFEGCKKIDILPGDTVLIETLEKIGMPETRKISGLVNSMVSMVSKGISHVSTTIDPDWKGPLVIAVTNHSKNIIGLVEGKPFCTIVFLENKSSAEKECGKTPGRSDVFLKNLASSSAEASEEEKRKEEKEKKRKKKIQRIGIYISFLLPILFLGLGYKFFGNASGIIAMVAIGGYFSQLIWSLLRVQYEKKDKIIG